MAIHCVLLNGTGMLFMPGFDVAEVTRLPDEPLIFVEVAMVNGLANNVQELLDEAAPIQDPKTVDTAIFYSISNAQKGLAGIGFGGFIIKQVADRLAREFKGLKTFATLSPIPGFRALLDRMLAQDTPNLLLPTERKTLTAAGDRSGGAKGMFKTLLADPHWHEDRNTVAVLQPILMRLCARYLILERRESGLALDPVAHFHLSNGASLGRLNWMPEDLRAPDRLWR